MVRGWANLESWVRLLRPEFWIVAVVPAWVGWALATRQAIPDQALVLDGFGCLRGACEVPEVAAWAGRSADVALAILTLGPLLGGSIMVTNDFFDRRVDRFNPKKTRSPLVAGTATTRRAVALMVALSTAALAASFALDAGFGVAIAAGLAMSFAYSAPPLRLKARPGADVAVNALGYGGIALVGGWSLGGGWGDPFPVGPTGIVALAIAAGYLPTVMMDREADASVGLRTTAVALGHRASWILGLEFLVAANVLMAALALGGRYVGPGFLPYLAVFFAVELVAYAVWVRRPDPATIFRGASVTTAVFFANLGAFLGVYTNVLPTP